MIIIGGGPGGYIAAVQAARLGLSVALIEERTLGGVCLNRGCIPTKTLVDTAKSIDAIADGKRRGITTSGPVGIDLKTAVQFKQRVVKRLSMGVESLLKNSAVTIIKGTAVVRPDLSVEVSSSEMTNNETASDTLLQAKKIILATGTNPMRLPIPGANDSRVLTSDEILELETVPESLAILGGGIIGVEMARIFSAFGSRVHIVEALDRICPFLDGELSSALTKTLTDRKIKVSTNAKLERIEALADKLVLHVADASGSVSTAECSHLLMAVGRSVDVRAFESLNLKRNGQFLAVDEAMRTSHPNVYAVGDVNGLCMLAHAAYRMGEIAAAHAATTLFDNAKSPFDGTTISVPRFDAELVPGGIFSAPEIGCVGLTEPQATERYGEIRVGRLPLIANGRAVVSGHIEGFVKVIADAKTERIVGVHILGLFASELINEAATAVANGLTVGQWGHVIHAHPSVAEALPEAALDCFERSLHLPKR